MEWSYSNRQGVYREGPTILVEANEPTLSKAQCWGSPWVPGQELSGREILRLGPQPHAWVLEHREDGEPVVK